MILGTNCQGEPTKGGGNFTGGAHEQKKRKGEKGERELCTKTGDSGREGGYWRTCTVTLGLTAKQLSGPYAEKGG